MKRRSFRTLFLIISWAFFTSTLSIWWMIFGMDLLDVIKDLAPERDVLAQQRMWFWEGLTLIAMIVVGAVGLIVLVIRENDHHQMTQNFYQTVAHDVKTSLAAIRLKAESLTEKLNGREQELATTVVEDSVVLELHIENALILANRSDLQLHLEKLEISSILQSLQYQWPQMRFQINGEATASADRRVLRAVFSNLIHNAYIHGKAKTVTFDLECVSRKIHIRVTDDGYGVDKTFDFSSDLTGKNKPSGTGMGLSLTSVMSKKIGGDFSVQVVEGRLVADLYLQEVES